MRSIFVAAITVLAATSAKHPAAAHDHAILRGRLVFADHEKPVVRILDLDTGDVTHAFDLPKANPGLVIVGDRRHVVIKTGDANGTVRILDTGLVRESHGDHDDVTKLPPRLHDLILTGDKPGHVVSDTKQVAVFFDGERPWTRASDPKVLLVDLPTLSGKAVVRSWKSAAPQHGIAVPLGRNQMLVSEANAAYAKGDDRSASARPDRFAIVTHGDKPSTWKVRLNLDDRAKPPAGCELYHGHADLRGTHVFGCKEGDDGGLLVLARRSGNWTTRRIAYPDGRRTSTIRGGAGRYLVGNYGSATPYDAFIRIDPAASSLSMADVFALSGNQSVCRFNLTGDGRRLANLTPDGVLRVYDIEPVWKEVASFEAVPAFDCSYGASTPMPDLAIIDYRAFVSDPSNGRIREYNLRTLKQGIDMPVGGMPTQLADDAAGG